MTSLDLRWLHLIMCDAEGVKVLLLYTQWAQTSAKNQFPSKIAFFMSSLPQSFFPPTSLSHSFSFLSSMRVCVSVDGSVSNGIEKIMLGPLL